MSTAKHGEPTAHGLTLGARVTKQRADAEILFESEATGDFLVVHTDQATLTLNRPKSWLARRIWRWFGFVWS